MPIDRECKPDGREIRTLTRREIEERLHRLVADVGGWSPDREPAAQVDGPRWISAADLVRRVRPFIVYN